MAEPNSIPKVDTTGLERSIDKLCETVDRLREERKRLEEVNTELLNACREALLWYGPLGDHVGDPARPLLLAAIVKAERGAAC